MAFGGNAVPSLNSLSLLQRPAFFSRRLRALLLDHTPPLLGINDHRHRLGRAFPSRIKRCVVGAESKYVRSRKAGTLLRSKEAVRVEKASNKAWRSFRIARFLLSPPPPLITPPFFNSGCVLVSYRLHTWPFRCEDVHKATFAHVRELLDATQGARPGPTCRAFTLSMLRHQTVCMLWKKSPQKSLLCHVSPRSK